MIGIPFVLLYTAGVYYFFRGKATVGPERLLGAGERRRRHRPSADDAGGCPVAARTAGARACSPRPEARWLLGWPSWRASLGAGCVVAAAWLLSLVIAAVFLEGRPRRRDAAARRRAASPWPSLRAPLPVRPARSLAQRAATRLKARLRSDLTGHLVALGPAYTGRERTGELASVLVDGLEAIDAYVDRLPAGAAARRRSCRCSSSWSSSSLDPPTTLVLLFTGPILVLLLAIIGSRTRAVSRPAVRRAALDERVLPRHAAGHRDAQDVRPQRRAGRQHADDQPPVRRHDDGGAADGVPDRRSSSSGAAPSRWRWWRSRSACGSWPVRSPFDRALAVLVITPGVLPAAAAAGARATTPERRAGRRRADVRDPGRRRSPARRRPVATASGSLPVGA